MAESGQIVMPVVSTSGAKARARGVTDVAGAQRSLMDILDLLDQIQTRSEDPRRMKVNQNPSKVKAKKWNQKEK